MTLISESLRQVRERIAAAEQRFGRQPGSVSLLAISKTWPAPALAEAFAAGQRLFGESYVQEALEKQAALAALDLEWHFVGAIQSNKTRTIGECFSWVHSVDRLKIAQRLSAQRPNGLPPLQICLQVNVSGENTKSGAPFSDLAPLAEQVAALPGLQLRGLMALPAAAEDFDAQRRAFESLRNAKENLEGRGLHLDTLSMGMSGDLEAAVAEGATIVRVGTAVFGARR